MLSPKRIWDLLQGADKSGLFINVLTSIVLKHDVFAFHNDLRQVYEDVNWKWGN